jgi:hypothetical protein
MPHIEGATVSISKSADGFTGFINLVAPPTGTTSGDFRRDGFAVGNELAIGPATVSASSGSAAYDTFSDHLTLHTGTWTGFQVGQQVRIAGQPDGFTWTVKGFADGGKTMELNGPTLTPLPNQTATVTAVSQYVGIVKAITQTQIVLNLAIALADFPSGPLFPASATNVVRDVKVLNRVGNSAPFFVFPLANPYLYSGNDVVDAHLLDWSDPTSALRPVGLTIYGGPGNDLIVGSQTGDHLAGGSGDDTILGQRGQDHIYGDSGFNVDLITRLLTVAVLGNGPAGYAAAQFKNKDDLTAGNDLLYGEGPGSAGAAVTNTIGNDDDIIFADLGVVSQDVSGARDVTKAVPAKPQKISTTSIGAQGLVSTGVTSVESKALQNGGNDWVYGNVDRDLLIGGPGNDAVDGGLENDLIFGDNISFVRTLGDFTSPRFQTLTGTLLYSRSERGRERRATRRRRRPAVPHPDRHAVVGRVRPARHLAGLRRRRRQPLGGQLRQRLPRRQPGERRHPRRARQRHDPGRQLHRLDRARQPRSDLPRRRVPDAGPVHSDAELRLRPGRPADGLPVGRARHGRRGLRRGQRRQRPDLREPGSG